MLNPYDLERLAELRLAERLREAEQQRALAAARPPGPGRSSWLRRAGLALRAALLRLRQA